MAALGCGLSAGVPFGRLQGVSRKASTPKMRNIKLGRFADLLKPTPPKTGGSPPSYGAAANIPWSEFTAFFSSAKATLASGFNGLATVGMGVRGGRVLRILYGYGITGGSM